MEKPAGTVAAQMEKDGLGTFQRIGKKIEFRATDGRLFAKWWAPTPADGETRINLFRASLKYFPA